MTAILHGQPPSGLQTLAEVRSEAFWQISEWMLEGWRGSPACCRE